MYQCYDLPPPPPVPLNESWTSLNLILGKIAHREGVPATISIKPSDYFFNPACQDDRAALFLQDMLREIVGVIAPDGFCLLHAISKYVYGNEILHCILRAKIYEELDSHRDWYLGKNADQYPNMMNLEFDEEQLSEFLRDAIPSDQDTAGWSPVEHIQALANIFKRPICLFGTVDLVAQEKCFTYLPLRIPPSECTKDPIAIAWSSASTGHFVTLGRLRGSSTPVIPAHLQPPPHRCSPEIANQYLDCSPVDGSFTLGLSTGVRPSSPSLQSSFAHDLVSRLINGACDELDAHRDSFGADALEICLTSTDGSGLKSPFYLKNLVKAYAIYVGPHILLAIEQQHMNEDIRNHPAQCLEFIAAGEVEVAFPYDNGIHGRLIEGMHRCIHLVGQEIFTISLWKLMVDELVTAIDKEFNSCALKCGYVTTAIKLNKFYAEFLAKGLNRFVPPSPPPRQREFPSFFLPANYVTGRSFIFKFSTFVFFCDEAQTFKRGFLAGDKLYICLQNDSESKFNILIDREVQDLVELGFSRDAVFDAFEKGFCEIEEIASYIADPMEPADQAPPDLVVGSAPVPPVTQAGIPPSVPIAGETDQTSLTAMQSPEPPPPPMSLSAPSLSLLPLPLSPPAAETTDGNADRGVSEDGIVLSPNTPATPLVSDPAQCQQLIAYLRSKARTAVRKEDYCLALASYTRALRLASPHDASDLAILHANRSMCHLKLGQVAEALADGELAVATNPLYVKGHYRCASALLAAGRCEEARGLVEAALDRAPTKSEEKDFRDLLGKIVAREAKEGEQTEMVIEKEREKDEEDTVKDIVSKHVTDPENVSKDPSHIESSTSLVPPDLRVHFPRVISPRVAPEGKCDGAIGMSYPEYRRWLRESRAQWSARFEQCIRTNGITGLGTPAIQSPSRLGAGYGFGYEYLHGHGYGYEQQQQSFAKQALGDQFQSAQQLPFVELRPKTVGLLGRSFSDGTGTCTRVGGSYLGVHQIASPPSLVGDVGMASESADECELEVDDDTDEKEYVILLRKVNTGDSEGRRGAEEDHANLLSSAVVSPHGTSFAQPHGSSSTVQALATLAERQAEELRTLRPLVGELKAELERLTASAPTA